MYIHTVIQKKHICFFRFALYAAYHVIRTVTYNMQHNMSQCNVTHNMQHNMQRNILYAT